MRARVLGLVAVCFVIAAVFFVSRNHDKTNEGEGTVGTSEKAAEPLAKTATVPQPPAVPAKSIEQQPPATATGGQTALPKNSPEPVVAPPAVATTPPASVPNTAPISSPPAMVPPPPVVNSVPTVPGQGAPVVSPEEVAMDVDKVTLSLRDYRTIMGENPVGTNAEITKALNGGNPKEARLLQEGLPVNRDGELVDRWGTPYFFHQLSKDHMQIRSAGPDRKMWTEDDTFSN